MQNSIIKELASKYNKSEEQVDYLIKNLWQNIKKDLSGGKSRDILLKGFGTFYLDHRTLYARLYSIKLYLTSLEREFQDNKDNISYETWMLYLTNWFKANKLVKRLEDILTAENKRNNRKKGDRGL